MLTFKYKTSVFVNMSNLNLLFGGSICFGIGFLMISKGNDKYEIDINNINNISIKTTLSTIKSFLMQQWKTNKFQMIAISTGCITAYYCINYYNWLVRFYYQLQKRHITCSRSLKAMPIHWDDLKVWPVQKINYLIQFFNAAMYITKLKLFGSIQPTDTNIVNLALSSTLSLIIDTNNDNEYFSITFNAIDLMFPWYAVEANKNPKQNMVKFTAVSDIKWTDIKQLQQQNGYNGNVKWKITAFICSSSSNIVPINVNSQRMNILLKLNAMYSHPKIHSYFNQIYKYRKELSEMGLGNLCLHGSMINESATIPAVIQGMSMNYIGIVLEYNGLQDIKHNWDTLKTLKLISPFCKYIFESHDIVTGLVSKYNLPCDGSAVFLSTVMHSTDHLTLWIYTKNMRLNSINKLPFQSPYETILYDKIMNNSELFAFTFVQPNQYYFTNLLKDNQYKHPFYQELYKKLYVVNKEYTNEVTLSISY
eukprot:175777_1